MRNRLLLVCVLLVVIGGYLHLVKVVPVLLERPLAKFPIIVEDWHMIQESEFSERVMEVLRPTDYLSRQYRNSEGAIVGLYIGYHGGREGDGVIHSPRNCLPGAGWFQNYLRPKNVDLGDGKSIELVDAVMTKEGGRQQFHYWFQVRDWILIDEYSLKIAEALNSALSRRKDESFIRISTAIVNDDEKASAKALEKFVKDFYPVIQGFLPS